MMLQAISQYLAKHGTPNYISSVTEATHHIIIEHGKSYYDFSVIYINTNNTITILKDWSKDRTIIDLADPELLPRILKVLQIHKILQQTAT
jgi:hypothetical protein